MRLGTATAMAVVGIEGRPVRIEAVLLRGLPAVTIVGLPDAAISESRERLRAAFASAGVAFPSCRLTINLSPAGTPKAGTAFDLGIAVAILGAMGGADRYAGSVVMGELGLDGSVRRVRGVLPAALAAAKATGAEWSSRWDAARRPAWRASRSRRCGISPRSPTPWAFPATRLPTPRTAQRRMATARRRLPTCPT